MGRKKVLYNVHQSGIMQEPGKRRYEKKEMKMGGKKTNKKVIVLEEERKDEWAKWVS